jgi:electron transport complex protein RnfG
MKDIHMRIIVMIAVLAGILEMGGCSSSGVLNSQQLAVLNGIIAARADTKQIKAVAVTPEVAQKFPAVNKMFKLTLNDQEYYGLVVNPQGYRAPINMMVVIDGKKNRVLGIKVMSQDETPGYGEWLAEKWFVERFKGKNVDRYLQRVVLEARESNDIVQITGATVTTQAVINGVNAAMGIYRRLILGQEAASVPLRVEGYVTESQ